MEISQTIKEKNETITENQGIDSRIAEETPRVQMAADLAREKSQVSDSFISELVDSAMETDRLKQGDKKKKSASQASVASIKEGMLSGLFSNHDLDVPNEIKEDPLSRTTTRFETAELVMPKKRSSIQTEALKPKPVVEPIGPAHTDLSSFDFRVTVSLQDAQVFQKLSQQITQLQNAQSSLLNDFQEQKSLNKEMKQGFVSVQSEMKDLNGRFMNVFESLRAEMGKMENLVLGLKQQNEHLLEVIASGKLNLSESSTRNETREEAEKDDQEASKDDKKEEFKPNNKALENIKKAAAEPSHAAQRDDLPKTPVVREAKEKLMAAQQHKDEPKAQVVTKPIHIPDNIIAAPPIQLATTQKDVKAQKEQPAQQNSAANVISPNASMNAPKLYKLPTEILNKNLPKEEMMRQNVIYEIIDSEADYVRDLNVMLEMHMKDLKAKRLLDDKEMKTMFSNLEELLPVNQQLLTSIVLRRDENPIIECFGDLLLNIAPSFMVYDNYCANYPNALQLYKEVKNREEMKAYLEFTINHPDFRGLSLESFLIKPVQRICKYPLLIKELIKQTPAQHKDKHSLEQALIKIEEVVTLVNERTRNAGERDKLIELASKIDNLPFDLTNQQGRRIIKEGPISRIVAGKAKDRIFILLSDMILLCKQQLMSKVRYQFEQSIDLLRSSVSAVVNPKSFSGNSQAYVKMQKTMFEITVTNNESFIFNCSSESEKDKWVTMIEENSKDSFKKYAALPVKMPAAQTVSASSPVSPTDQQQQQPQQNQTQPNSSQSSTVSFAQSVPAAVKQTQSTGSMGGGLKKSNTLSIRKRANLWSRKKNSSQEDLTEDPKPESNPTLPVEATKEEDEKPALVVEEKLAPMDKNASVRSTRSQFRNPLNTIFASIEKPQSAPPSQLTQEAVSRQDSSSAPESIKDEGKPRAPMSRRASIASRMSFIGVSLPGSNTETKNDAAPVEQKQAEPAAAPTTEPAQSEQKQPEAAAATTGQQDPATQEVQGFPKWRAVDAGDSRVYYYNVESGETSWYHPSVLAVMQNDPTFQPQAFEQPK